MHYKRQANDFWLIVKKISKINTVIVVPVLSPLMPFTYKEVLMEYCAMFCRFLKISISMDFRDLKYERNIHYTRMLQNFDFFCSSTGLCWLHLLPKI